MTFLPIVERELRVRARQGATFWTRAAVGFVAGQLATQSFMYSYGVTNPSRIGPGVFLALTWMAQIIALASITLTADCLSVERRGGTLGLLFLTDLKGYDVVLGKLASTGLGAFYALLGMVPALAIPLLAGGVTGGEVPRYALAVLNTLFLSLALGLWVSSRSREQMLALRRAAGLLLAVWLAPLVLQWIITLGRSKAPSVALLSPQCAFNLAADLRYRTDAANFWLALLAVHLEGWGFIWAASRTLLTSWREAGPGDAAIPGAPATAARFGHEEPLRPREFLGLPVVPETEEAIRRRVARTATPYGPDPLQWLVRQLPGQRALLWVAALFAVLPSNIWLVSRLVGFGGGVPASLGMILATQDVFYFGSRVLFAWVACRLFLELRRSGALELLLSTPLGARGLVPAQRRVLRQQLLAPLVILVLLQSPNWLALWFGWRFASGALVVGQVFLLVMQALNMVLEILALCRVGLWFGLTAHRPMSAVVWTAGLVTGLPWLAVTGLSMVIMLARAQSAGVSPPTGFEFWWVFSYFVSPILLLLKNVFFLAWARHKLKGDLRDATVQALAVGTWKEGRRWEALRQFLAPS